MNAKPWLPVMAAVLVGTHLLSARASQMRQRWEDGRVRPSGTADVDFNGAQPQKLWSSMATRMIHVVEEVAMIAIAALFVGGMVGLMLEF